MAEKCFCHFNGYAVKDATARKNIESLAAALEDTNLSVEAINEDLAKNKIDAEAELNTIKEEASNIKENINQLDSELLNIGSDVQLLTDRKILFIGDSYAAGSQLATGESAWCAHAALCLGLSKNNSYWVYAKGGASFGTQDPAFNFLYQAETAANDLGAQCTDITDIVVGGGANDHASGRSNIQAGMKAFSEYCLAHFPNAKLHLFAMGWNVQPMMRKNLQAAYYSYSMVAAPYKFNFYNGLYKMLQNKNRMSDDGVHPNAAGQSFLGYTVANMLKGATCDVDSPVNAAIYLKNASGNYDSIGYALYKNDSICLHLHSGSIALNSAIPTTLTKLADISCYLLYGCATNHIGNHFTTTVMINGNTTEAYTENIEFCIIRNSTSGQTELWARSLKANGTVAQGFSSVKSIAFLGNYIDIPIWCA